MRVPASQPGLSQLRPLITVLWRFKNNANEMRYAATDCSKNWSRNSFWNFFNSPISPQHSPLYPFLQWHDERISVPPFKQKRLHALAPTVVTRHLPPHWAGLMIFLLVVEWPLGPQVWEQSLHGLHSPGMQSTGLQYLRRRRLEAQLNLGSETISFTRQIIINTIEVIRVTYSHLILSMAHSPAYNFQYVKCALPICAGFNASIRVMTIFCCWFSANFRFTYSYIRRGRVSSATPECYSMIFPFKLRKYLHSGALLKKKLD